MCFNHISPYRKDDFNVPLYYDVKVSFTTILLISTSWYFLILCLIIFIYFTVYLRACNCFQYILDLFKADWSKPGVSKLFSGRPQRQLLSAQCDPRSIYFFFFTKL